MNKIIVEVLAFEGCPNVEQARRNVAEALRLEGIVAEVRTVEVDSPETAESRKFLGSPSVRVNGTDVEDAASTRDAYGLMCRTYSGGTDVFGAPSVQMIRVALRRP